MENLTNREWVSSHIFYTDHNKFLIEALPAFLEGIKKRFSIHKYFFIRYWELGPHIRLRMSVDTKDIEEIKKEIVTFFNNYLDNNPSVRNLEKDHFLPNNTVHFIEYEPEVERYGGEEGIVVAESHFQDSSETVLDLMSQIHQNWNLSVAQGLALQLSYAFIKGTSLNEDEIKEMLFIMDNSHWKERARIVSKTENVDVLFEKQFAKNKEAIAARLKMLDEIFADEENTDESPILQWHHYVKEKDAALKNLSLNKKRHFIYISYLHMLNNRLGLSNHDEGYISYVLYNSLVN